MGNSAISKSRKESIESGPRVLSNDANPFAGYDMSPRQLQIKKILEGTSISLEQQEELQGHEVCSEEVTKTQPNSHRHGLDWD